MARSLTRQSVVTAFRKGLNETGFFEGRNVTVEYHWTEGQNNRVAGPGSRFGPPTSGGDRRQRLPPARSRPRLQPRRSRSCSRVGGDPVKHRSRRKPRPARRQRHWHQVFRRTRLVTKRLGLLRELVSEGGDRLLVNPAIAAAAEEVKGLQASRASAREQILALGGQHHRRDRGSLCNHQRANGLRPTRGPRRIFLQSTRRVRRPGSAGSVADDYRCASMLKPAA